MSTTVVDNRMPIDYGLAKDALKYCTRETVCETKTEQTYRWVDAKNGTEYAYGIYTKIGALVEFHGSTRRKPALFEGDEAKDLKKVGRGIPETIEIIPVPADGKVTVLWNGGWDDYKIDPKQVRNMTAAELSATQAYWPTVSQVWLKCSFIKQFGLGDDNKVVHILEHLGSGD